MKCKEHGETLPKRIKKSMDCSVKRGKFVVAFISVLRILLGIILGIYIIMGFIYIPIKTSQAKVMGFLNGPIIESGYYEEILIIYPLYFPAQSELVDIYLDQEGLYRKDTIYEYESELEELYELDKFINAPWLQIKVDQKIEEYSELLEEATKYFFENELKYAENTVPKGEAVHPVWENNNLPAMDNVYYVQWEGKIYFRQYNAQSMASGGMNAELGYSEGPMIEKDLLCMSSDGKITCVGSDYGFGSMYIKDMHGEEPRIFSVRIGENGNWQIYSCDLDGGNVEVLYTQDKNEYSDEPYIQLEGLCGDKLFFTDSYNNFYYVDVVNKGNVSEVDVGFSDWFAFDENALYTHDVEAGDFMIQAYYYNGEKRNIACIRMDELYEGFETQVWEYSSRKVTDVQKIDNKIYFQMLDVSNNENVILNGVFFVLDLDTKVCTRVTGVTSPECTIVKEDNNTWVYHYYTEMNSVTGENERYIVTTQLEGSDEAPTGVCPWAINDKLTLEDYAYADYDLLATPDYSGYSYLVLSKEEIDSLEIETPTIFSETNGEVKWNVVRAEYVGDKLFFSVEVSDHTPAKDEDGIPYYTRRITYDYCKDLSTGEITLLHSY